MNLTKAPTYACGGAA
jgi:hypothetical protein